MSARVLFGAAALGRVSQAEADRTLDLLLAYGINHIDTAASYGDSEERIGPWMQRGLRSQFFVATKTGERAYAAAKASIHRSLERMKIDQIDLIQLHCLIDQHEWDEAMGDDGALRACIEARDEGLVRFIGVTGHEIRVARMHRQSCARFDFDSVLLPYNFPLIQNPDYAPEFEALLSECAAADRAVQTIKSITQRPWTANAPERGNFATWYKPLTSPDAIYQAISWVLGRPGVFLNSVGDVNLLPLQLAAVNRFYAESPARPSDAAMQALVADEAMAPFFV
jgi:predicted aldo/keto reductase-like oxidoreductase